MYPVVEYLKLFYIFSYYFCFPNYFFQVNADTDEAYIFNLYTIDKCWGKCEVAAA